ncbi:MAG: META domain-containing protein [Anaerolineales bacterium]|nr:META domain-containing protein [Anaerolineales bacterium]
MKKFALGLLFILMLSACGGGKSASLVGQWELESFGSASSQTPAVEGVDTSIEFNSDGKLSGNVGCNVFNGDYKADGSALTFGPVATTRMFCENVAEQESATLAVFSESASFALDGDTLTMTSADGASVIVLARR